MPQRPLRWRPKGSSPGPARGGRPSCRRRNRWSAEDVLNAERPQKLLYLLQSTEDAVITKRAQVPLGSRADFSADQVVIRGLGGVSIAGSKIGAPTRSFKEKADDRGVLLPDCEHPSRAPELPLQGPTETWQTWQLPGTTSTCFAVTLQTCPRGCSQEMEAPRFTLWAAGEFV